MTPILAMFILFCVNIARPLALRPLAVGRRAGDACMVTGCWFLLGSLLMLPLTWPLVTEAWPTLQAKPWLFAVGLLKGLSLWLIIFLDQTLRKHSNSSSEFKGFPTIALVATINVFYLDETLTLWEWFSVLTVAMLGLVFMLRGHIATLSNPYKAVFLALIVLCTLPACTDVIVITQTNWYIQLAASTLGILLGAALNPRSRNWVATAFTNRDCMIMGLVCLVAEVVILMLLVTHISVTLAFLASRLAIPAMMLISYILYGEGRWQTQLLFGVLAYLAALPIILLS